MASISQKNIVPGIVLTAAAVVYHTAPVLTRERITNATITNDTAGVVAATVHIVPMGGGAATANKKISARNIAPGETYCCPELVNRVLEPGDTIQALGLGLALDVSAFTQS